MNELQAIQKTVDVIRRQHKAISTEESYIQWLRRYMAALRHFPNTLTSEQKMERFLTELALKQNVSVSTQNPAFGAILFFYRDVLKV